MPLITDGSRYALTAPGFFHTVTTAELPTARNLYGDPVTLSTAGFNYAKQLTAGDAGTQIADLPAQIPLTVQGASEAFITDRMLQVQNRVDTNCNQLNVFNAQYRDQVKAHVTTEANRVIASS
jgi:hypothetical protein